MAKILISWIAWNNDFREGQVDTTDGPNYLFHRMFYDYNQHLLLSSAKEGDTRSEMITNKLITDFPDHGTVLKYMNISNVIDLNEVKTKIETLLLEYQDDEIDIYFSPGTSIMQVSWYICHTTLGLKTRLLQTTPGKFAKSGKPELMEITVEKSSIPTSTIIKENVAGKSSVDKIGKSVITKGMADVYTKAGLVASTDRVTILITGSSGTGKELLAKYIHENSVRKTKPYIAINCSAFNDQLLESRLFGYKKGAFTGADKDTIGLFDKASGGTIFLDEIGDISPYMQQSLLRVIQEKEIHPIGGNPVKIDVRIISATNRNLVQLCTEGKFRWDLYYRLAVAELELPSLAYLEKNEIEELMNHFIKIKKKELGKSSLLKLSSEARDYLLSYPFPGNIRELENLVESLYVFNEDGILDVEDIPERFKNRAYHQSLRLEDVEKALIEKVLKIKHGNLSQTQQTIGYGSVNTLKSKIKKYGIAY